MKASQRVLQLRRGALIGHQALDTENVPPPPTPVLAADCKGTGHERHPLGSLMPSCCSDLTLVHQERNREAPAKSKPEAWPPSIAQLYQEQRSWTLSIGLLHTLF